MARPVKRRPQRRSCLNQLLVLATALLVGVAIYGFFVRPALSSMLGAQISERIAPLAQAETLGESALPGVVAALPSGPVVVEQVRANAFLADHQGDYGPIEDVQIQFRPGEASANVQAMGVRGVVRSGVTVVNGQITLVNPQIDGPLGLLVSSQDLINPLLERLNAELANQGRIIEDIQIEDGRVVVITR
ncbi:hypothetical protein OSCT_0501 [Oscillochloris trichoides DG-6]|uniref:Uncharacterized protein n=1 Tax=Oscillochloris trichoides DG-6 TaxID=765420 RepID=E1IB00_9CHLR|nr:hypothetical protein OSCT_0501 [Oscillochloris trichoides DG-6]